MHNTAAGSRLPGTLSFVYHIAIIIDSPRRERLCWHLDEANAYDFFAEQNRARFVYDFVRTLPCENSEGGQNERKWT